MSTKGCRVSLVPGPLEEGGVGYHGGYTLGQGFYTLPHQRGGHCGGRYASYWNAVFLKRNFLKLDKQCMDHEQQHSGDVLHNV